LHIEAPQPAGIDAVKLARAAGRCDVIVYGPKANGNLQTIGQDKRRLLLAAWNDRYETLYNQGCKFVLPFENRGDEVGVTLHHPAFCPPFARFPFETWIAPNECKRGPWDFNEDQLDGFAHLLGDMTRRYDEFFQRPTAYMLSLHAAPLSADNRFHFTAQFYPILRTPERVKYLASVEQSTGTFTVDVMPEMAAKTLRAL